MARFVIHLCLIELFVYVDTKRNLTPLIKEPQKRSERSGKVVLKQRSAFTFQGEAALL